MNTPVVPALFVGHGSPMNAIQETPWSRGWAALGAALPTPKAILCVSAHWYVRGSHVTGNRAPKLIYDGREQPSWAVRFDDDVARALEQRDVGFLVRALESDAGRRAHPSPDHYLPLLYAVGAAEEAESVRFPVNGFDLGSLSMRSVVLA